MKSHTAAHSFDILHVSAGCWARGGGLSEAVAQLVLAQAQLGKRVALVYLADHEPHPVLKRCRAAGATLFPLRRQLKDPFFFSIQLWRQLPRLVAQSERLIIHGGWSFPVYWAARCARKARIPYAVISHGSLDPVRLRYGKWRKKLVWGLSDRNVLRHAQWIHAASEWEAQWIRDELHPLPCPPIRQTSLGVDGKCFDSVPDQPRSQTLLYLGRNHPLKGLDLLLDAWQRANLGDMWQLHLASPDSLPEKLPGNVRNLGALHGEAKARALKSAAGLILPTRSESFGLVVAEALWCRTPVICTKGAPWQALGDFWVDATVEALADALLRFSRLPPSERNACFAPLFDSARTRFDWQHIAQELFDAF